MAKKKRKVFHNHNVDTHTNEDKDQLFLTPGSKEYEDAKADDPLQAFTVNDKHLLPPILTGKVKPVAKPKSLLAKAARGAYLASSVGLGVPPISLSELESKIVTTVAENEGYVPKALRKYE